MYISTYRFLFSINIDGNGNINIIDALLIAQYYVGMNVDHFNLAAGDVTGCNGIVDIVDALLVAQYYVGLISQFPCE